VAHFSVKNPAHFWVKINNYGISAVVTGWRKAEIGDQLPSLAA
jgi:hypothetical protein